MQSYEISLTDLKYDLETKFNYTNNHMKAKLISLAQAKQSI